jgi:hypothetical protein
MNSTEKGVTFLRGILTEGSKMTPVSIFYGSHCSPLHRPRQTKMHVSNGCFFARARYVEVWIMGLSDMTVKMEVPPRVAAGVACKETLTAKKNISVINLQPCHRYNGDSRQILTLVIEKLLNQRTRRVALLIRLCKARKNIWAVPPFEEGTPSSLFKYSRTPFCKGR